MYTRVKKKYLIGAAAAIVVIVTAVLFLPGFSGQTPPPETIGGDFVSAGADFENGTLSGTSVAPTAKGGEIALSLQPSMPQGDYLSEPQETPYAFNALGLHWKADLPEGARVDAEVRFSQDGEQWGDWQPVTTIDDELPNHFASTKSAGETIGDLVFADAARFFQYRLNFTSNAAGDSPVVTKMTASYIDAKGYHESPLSVAKIVRDLSAAIKPALASATPNIISRAQWVPVAEITRPDGSKYSMYGDDYTMQTWPPEYASPQKIVLHHTAGGWDADPAVTMRSTYQYHAVSLGWGDIGYNYLIGPQGQIYEGRMGGNGVIGGHARGWNTGSIGISVMGNYENYDINGAQYNGIVELMTWAANVNHIDPYGNDYFIHYENSNPVGGYPGNILGHRDLAGNSTACPGNYLYARMPQFRAEVNARYSPVPIIGDILVRWNSLNRAPGAALAPEYAINGYNGAWIGQAQDFANGRLTWNNSTGNVFWSKGAILAKWDALGRQASFLGMPLSDEYDVPGGKAQNFTGGRIYWSAASGAHEMHGEILNKFVAVGGSAAIGFPTTDEQYVSGVADARENQFTNGRIYWHGSIGAFEVRGAIFAKYLALGGPTFLGLPISDEMASGPWGGRESRFQNDHRIYWSAAGGAHMISGDILTRYLALGGPAIFGVPTTDIFNIAGISGAQECGFQAGRFYSSASAGTHEVHGAILSKYLAAGGPQAYGLPTTDETTIPGVSAARMSQFQYGNVYWSTGTGAHVVYGAILTRYKQMVDPLGAGADYSSFGLPTTDETGVPGYAGGRKTELTGATIYWSAATGAHEVHGAIRDKWLATGGPAGFVGLPVSDEQNVTGVTGAKYNQFQSANIYWSAGTGAREVHGSILARYLTLDPAALGLPTTDETSVPGYASGRKTELSGATIYWSATTGAHEVHGAIRDKWLVSGGPAGFAGLPLSDEQNVTGVTGAKYNQFQGANIYWSAGTGAHEVHGAILLKYIEYGGPASELGMPVTDEYVSGSGRRNDLQGGYIYWDSRSGAQAFVGNVHSVTADTTFEARDGSGVLLATLGAGQVATVRYSKPTGTYSLQAPGVSRTGTSQVRFTATGGIMQVASYHDVPSWNTSLDDNKFRGTIEVRYSPASDAVWVVNELLVEDYMKGIAETSSGSPAEFLKTMTVAARSYAIWHLDRNGKYGGSEIFHLKNSRNGNGDDQVYKGYGLEARFPELVSAVNATSGQVVTYGGAVAMTSYFSNSDGRTRSAQEAWGVTYWPWLQSVSDPDCNGMSLNGHGVGLSGTGALARAGRGNSYSTILGYYYTGTAISPGNTARNIKIAISYVTP